jgi:phosphate transport system permease protein
LGVVSTSIFEVIIDIERSLLLIRHTCGAGYSLGIPKRKVILHIVLKSAKSGVLTRIILAISRIAGETAPLIMTILGDDLFFTSLKAPVDALSLRIWRLASQPYQYTHDFGWAAALVLVIIIIGEPRFKESKLLVLFT